MNKRNIQVTSDRISIRITINHAHLLTPLCTHLHHQVHVRGGLLAVEQRDDVLVMQFGELLEDFDLLAEQVLRLADVFLCDALDGHRRVGTL